jgi:hypothetical protein
LLWREQTQYLTNQTQNLQMNPQERGGQMNPQERGGRMNMKGTFKVAILFTVIALMAASAFATPTLRLTSGAARCTLTDGAAAAVCVGGGVGSGDSTGAAGAVSGTFSIGVFTVNVSTGITKPLAGSATNPYMDLNTVNVSSGAGMLIIEFSETDFTAIGNAVMRFGGTTSGGVAYGTFASPTNAVFSGFLLAGTPFMGPGPYAGTLAGGAPASAPYSLSQVLIIQHAGAGTSSGNHELLIPEPGILSLLGFGLAALGVIRRRMN